MSWVMYSSASWKRSRRSSSRFSISSRIETSSMDTGSSASSTVGRGGQCPRERDPLEVPAGQLVRVLDQEVVRRGEPHLFHQGGDLGVGVRALAVVQLQRALQVIAHRVHRVQRGERVLEDVLDLALVAAEIVVAPHLDRLAVQLDRAGGE